MRVGKDVDALKRLEQGSFAEDSVDSVRLDWNK